MNQITLQAIITSIRSKQDRSIGLSIVTPELSTTERALFMELQGLNLDLTITPREEDNVTEYVVNKDLDQKTPAQRLRGVLYILFEKNNEGHSVFDTYYAAKMNGFIEHLKGKIDE